MRVECFSRPQGVFVLAAFSVFILRCIVPGVRVLGSIFRVYA